jgi:PAP2 superfamily protein
VNLRSIAPLAVVLCSPVLLAAQSFDDELPAPSAPVAQDGPRELAPSVPDASKLLGPLPSLELEGDGRRTMGRFLPNLGRNLVGVWSPQNLKPFALGVAATGLGTLADDPAKNYFGARSRAQDFGKMGQSFGGGRVMGSLAVGLFVAGRASNDTRFRAATYDLTQAMLVTGAYTSALKLAVHRGRPDGSNKLSFPSGHTSNAFAFATVADHYYGRRVGIAAYALAGAIGISRMEQNKHHASDVAAGAALGWIVGRTVVRKDGEPLAKKRELSLVPMTAPSGTGVGMGLSVTF